MAIKKNKVIAKKKERYAICDMVCELAILCHCCLLSLLAPLGERQAGRAKSAWYNISFDQSLEGLDPIDGFVFRR